LAWLTVSLAIVSGMAGSATEESEEDWAEANILPSPGMQPEALLLRVVGPLIHETLSGRIDSWHYFWEHDPIQTRHLRLRVLWNPGHGCEGRDALATYLDEAEARGRVQRWYPGNHGVPGAAYAGEATDYGGPELWRITHEDWRAGSELALTLMKLDAEGGLAEARQFHLERRVHLHSNRLGMSLFDEGRLYLRLAVGYFANAGLGATADGVRVLATLSQINEAITAAIEQNKAT
jgi:Lantibiotic biosynthesis dehydratase C-term